jgi:hypothetical protein
LNGNFYQGKGQDDDKILFISLLENLRDNKKVKLMESIDRLFSLYKIGETTWRYQFLDHQEVKETEPFHSNFSPSISKLQSKSDRYIEEGGAKLIFELLQSKLKRTEIFILFHLFFNPKGDPMFLEMNLIPSSDKGVNFIIPFNPSPSQ